MKFSEIRKRKYLELLSAGRRRYAAAREVGVSFETVRRHMRDEQAFRDAVDEAEMAANEQVEDALFKAALEGNVTACQVWLYNRDPERWKDQRNVKVMVGEEELDAAIKSELERVAPGREGPVAAATEADAQPAA